MRARQVIAVVLVAALVVPVSGVSASPVYQTGDAGGSGASDSGTDSFGNYSRLYIDGGYEDLRLKPGESDSLTVTVENIDDDTVTLDPHVVADNPRARPIPDEWFSVSVSDESLSPDEDTEITLSVDVPADATIGDYRSRLALTDETVAAPGRPPRPVHSVTLHVDVWREPTVHLRSDTHMHTQVRAGGTHTHEVVVENTGDTAVPLAPTFEEGQFRGPPGRTAADRSWFEIDAPPEIGPGEQATVEITVQPPADATRDRYDATLMLGVEDPARDDRDDYWQRVRLNFQVWTPPSEPFTETFDVRPGTERVELQLNPHAPPHRGSDGTDRPGFNVTFTAPDGSTVPAERVRVTDRGSVGLSDTHSPVETQGEYAIRNRGTEFVYAVDDPTAGTWTVDMMPDNTVGFQYEVIRHEG